MAKKIIILGAGLAGLSAAWHLKKKGIQATVFEKEAIVGGLCRTKKVNGFVFDYDGHLLHFQNNYALKLSKRLLKGNLIRHERKAWVSNFGIFSRYPFQANLNALPKPVAEECLWGFVRVCNAKPAMPGENFLKWINATFGLGIAKHFMVPYNEKFWAVPLNQMVCSLWVEKFIPRVYLSDIVNGFLEGSCDHFGYNAFFWYPKKGGIMQLPLAFEESIGKIFKNSRINRIDLEKKEITINGKDKEKYDSLILTIPLPELIKIARPLPHKILACLNKLQWNSIYNLNLGVEGTCQPDKHWVYFPHKETVFFRAGFFHNFSHDLAPKGKSSLYAEVSYSRNKPINRKNIVKHVLRDLYKLGVITKKNKILVTDENDIKYGYPVYNRNYIRATSVIKDFLYSNGVITCGRYGSWKYMSMEDSILDGKEAAEVF
ncbi:MAG: FAD-dependent oxidoreductase [Candidatus Omnitrophica bacterium]|jgi:protoporphyrinogen oxidase|nr:FAD-dependent oxidoreductase [Candidatus Omnitrophota bacterium]MDD5660763.1 FAD-dependent oxidoreductase [Candidatus Omnitrophota bacterium]